MKKQFKCLIPFLLAALIAWPAWAITIQGGDGSAMQGGSARIQGGEDIYTANNGVRFDGSNDSMLSPGDWNGSVDGKQGIFSCWIRVQTAAISQIIAAGAFSTAIQFSTTNGGTISVLSGGGLNLTVTGVGAGSTWYHLLASWDRAAGTSNFYLNDSNSTFTENANTDANLDYNNASWRIGSLVNQTNKFDGAIQELYWDFTSTMDFSVVANRRKFISAAGKPVDLGSDGSIPTGTQPIIYFKNVFGSFEINSGSGGNTTITGALTDDGTSPSD